MASPNDTLLSAFLLRALDKADTWTLRHSVNVAEIARLLDGRRPRPGAAAAPGRTEVVGPEAIWLAGLLHDIGKLGIDPAILEKPGPLDAAEYALVQRHPALGYAVLHRLFDQWSISAGALHHHERYDGGGYPAGLTAGEIPVTARVIAVADSYDAIRGRRPYKGQDGHAAAVREIERCAATQFDPEMVAVFLDNRRAVDDAYAGLQRLSDGALYARVLERLERHERAA